MTFEDVKKGLRPLPCVQPAKSYDGLDIAVETCSYNVDNKMPAVCGYLGKRLEDGDVVMVCGQVWMQDTCTSKWRLTMKQCVLPVEKPELD